MCIQNLVDKSGNGVKGLVGVAAEETNNRSIVASKKLKSLRVNPEFQDKYRLKYSSFALEYLSLLIWHHFLEDQWVYVNGKVI